MRLISVGLNFPTIAFWIYVFSKIGLVQFSEATNWAIAITIANIWLTITILSYIYWAILGHLSIGCLSAVPWLILSGAIALILPTGYIPSYSLAFPSLYHLLVYGAIIGILRWPDYLIYKNVRVPAN